MVTVDYELTKNLMLKALHNSKCTASVHTQQKFCSTHFTNHSSILY